MHVMVAGAGGILGRKLVHAYLAQGFHVTAMGYSKKEFDGMGHPRLVTVACDVTKPDQLAGLCQGVELIVSCLGITRLRNSRLTHMAVDYEGNLNLLREAERSGVRKFAFITPAGTAHGDEHGVPLLQAKHLFNEELKRSGVQWVIFLAGGFYADLAEMGKMAAKGPMVVIGWGRNVFTPVDVQDVASVMVEDSLARSNAVVEIGGPEDMSWNEICRACFEHHGTKPRIMHIPAWLCHVALVPLKWFSPSNYAMGKLIVFMSTHDLTTEKRGTIRFADYLATDKALIQKRTLPVLTRIPAPRQLELTQVLSRSAEG